MAASEGPSGPKGDFAGRTNGLMEERTTGLRELDINTTTPPIPKYISNLFLVTADICRATRLLDLRAHITLVRSKHWCYSEEIMPSEYIFHR